MTSFVTNLRKRSEPNKAVERMAAGHTDWQFRERLAAAIAHF
jgi:hypothetical protein